MIRRRSVITYFNACGLRSRMRRIEPDGLLGHCPIDAPAAIERHDGRYTLILGDRILAKDRTVLRPVPNPLNIFGDREPSGSIGFLTFIPEPAYLKGAFAIYTIGVEKGHQGHGYCTMMLDWSEAAARTLGLPEVAVINVMNLHLADSLERRGYRDDYGTGFFPMYHKRVGTVRKAVTRGGFSIDDIPGVSLVRSFWR